jgi:Flp pilus assembly protein TadG
VKLHKCHPRTLERGAATIEITLLVPALVIFLGLLIAGGRLWFARTAVVEAANASARAASLARTAAQANADGQSTAGGSLSTSRLDCADRSVVISTAAFSAPVGTPATVTSTISCGVPFSDILLPGMPGSIRITGRGASALDTYRSRS